MFSKAGEAASKALGLGAWWKKPDHGKEEETAKHRHPTGPSTMENIDIGEEPTLGNDLSSSFLESPEKVEIGSACPSPTSDAEKADLDASRELLYHDIPQLGPNDDLSTGAFQQSQSRDAQEQHSGFHATETNHRLDEVQLMTLRTAGHKLIEQQENVSATRSHVRELRVALGHKREEEIELRTSFMKKLNTAFAQKNLDPNESILQEYELLQSKTDAYLELENSYHEAEDDLEQKEYELTVSMETFSAALQSALDNSPRESRLSINPFPRDGYGYSNGDQNSTASSNPDLPPCVAEYLSRVGDLRILQEHLADLEYQKATLLEKQEQRSSLQIPLDEESEEFLRTYDEERGEIAEELDSTRMDVNRLRDICEDQGYSTELYTGGTQQYSHQTDGDESHSTNRSLEEEEEEEDPDITTTAPGEHYLPQEEQEGLNFNLLNQIHDDTNLDKSIEDPLRWSVWTDFSPFSEPPQPLQPPTQNLSQSQTLPPNRPAHFINNWLLHQLRHSTAEIQRFKSREEFRELVARRGWDDARISRLALEGWFLDESNSPVCGPVSSPALSSGVSDAVENRTDGSGDRDEYAFPYTRGRPRAATASESRYAGLVVTRDAYTGEPRRARSR